jgi:hypothetical protein
MKTKMIIQIISVMVIGLMSSFSYGSDDFYYGSLHCLNLGTNYLYWQKDSLKSNIGFSADINSSNIQFFVNETMRAVPENDDSVNDSPKYWARVSHYTMWEAEGLSGSNLGFTYHGGGILISSSAASGGKAMYFCSPPDTPGLIQTGPWYLQEWRYDPLDTSATISYTAVFRLRSPLGFPTAKSSGSPTSICSLMVVSIDSSGDTLILKSKTLTSRDFPEWIGYNTFTLNYQLPTPLHDENWRWVDFRIYWFGNRALYVDYVKVYDFYGNRLMSGQADINIKEYVSQSWVDTTIYRWYLRDEPGFIDSYRPIAYVDTLLRQISQERAGLQFICGSWEEETVHEYLLRVKPKDYAIDIYPTGWCDLCSTFSGSKYQETWDKYMGYLNRAKTIADSLNKDLWLAIQAHTTAVLDSSDTCHFQVIQYNGQRYCCRDNHEKRNPTPNEVRLQTFLGLCYGADAILNYHFPFSISGDGKYLETGLYDGYHHSDSSRFQEITHFTGARARKLGQQIKQMTWQGACSDQDVGSFVLRSQPNYIDSIVGIRQLDSTYVQVGFFSKPDSVYFMLVNRRTLPSESDTFEVYFNFTDGPYVVTDMYNSVLPEGKTTGLSRYKIFLQPGEGRLFKLEKFHPNCVYCVPRMFDVICYPNYYPSIQAAINAAADLGYSTVLVDTGTYYENIDFKGKNITVAGRFHLDGDTSHISHTIIDGSQPVDSSKASVVRFVSGENSNTFLKGFTIRNGWGTLTHFEGDLTARWGGGIECYNSSPTIINNVIISNNSMPGTGGGIFANSNSSVQILNNIIKQNVATSGGRNLCW